MVTNLKDYKIAKKFVNDSEHFLKVIDLSIRGLKPFVIYKPIKKILFELEEQKSSLEAHLTTANKILKRNVE